ncbi:MAG: hypothetical protein LBS88_06985 [Tannerellaceae bacterium]|nr:hypothetical protein [Tannerellaceae bacterium]
MFVKIQDYPGVVRLMESTAYRRLRELVAQGKLQKVGRRSHPLYMPASAQPNEMGSGKQ